MFENGNSFICKGFRFFRHQRLVIDGRRYRKDPSARFSLIKNEKRPAIVKGNIRDGGRANSYQFPIHLDSDGGGVSSITLNTTFDGHVVCGFSSISATFGMA